jgi:hypothetical protein
MYRHHHHHFIAHLDIHSAPSWIAYESKYLEYRVDLLYSSNMAQLLSQSGHVLVIEHACKTRLLTE